MADFISEKLDISEIEIYIPGDGISREIDEGISSINDVIFEIDMIIT